jgi:hypothetical protein
MARSWLFGGLLGSAVCIMAAALPSTHRGTDPNATAAGDATGEVSSHATAATIAAANSNGMHVAMHYAPVTREAPHYRVPIGSPIPNPPNLPGHEHPYLGANHATPSGAAYSGQQMR